MTPTQTACAFILGPSFRGKKSLYQNYPPKKIYLHQVWNPPQQKKVMPFS